MRWATPFFFPEKTCSILVANVSKYGVKFLNLSIASSTNSFNSLFHAARKVLIRSLLMVCIKLLLLAL